MSAHNPAALVALLMAAPPRQRALVLDRHVPLARWADLFGCTDVAAGAHELAPPYTLARPAALAEALLWSARQFVGDSTSESQATVERAVALLFNEAWFPVRHAEASYDECWFDIRQTTRRKCGEIHRAWRDYRHASTRIDRDALRQRLAYWLQPAIGNNIRTHRWRRDMWLALQF